MAALTLAQLITRIEDNAGRTDQSDAQCVDWLNDCLHTLARRHNWRDLHVPDSSATMTIGTFRYSFPTGMKTCHGIRLINGTASKWLIERTRRWLNQYEPYPAGSSNGIPSFYCVDGNSFDLYPPPDTAYTYYVNYTKWPTAFSSATTTATCEITDIDDVLVAYGTAELFRKLGQDDRAASWDMVFERRYRDARIDDDSRPNFMPVHDGVITAGHVGPPSSYWNDPFYEG